MSITPATVRGRIPYWNDHPQAGGYSSTRMSRGPDGHLYRHDCSGYLSMLLSLHDNPYTGAMIESKYVTPIDRAELRFGDALIAVAGNGWSEGHCVLFDHWTDSNHYALHEWGWGPAPEHRTVRYPYQDPGGTADSRTFRPYRFRNLAAPAADDDGEVHYGPWYHGDPATRLIELGCTGDDVRAYQEVWNAWYPKETQLLTDGQFGPKTDKATRYLQGRAHIDVDGQVGRVTWRTLGYTVRY